MVNAIASLDKLKGVSEVMPPAGAAGPWTEPLLGTLHVPDRTRPDKVEDPGLRPGSPTKSARVCASPVVSGRACVVEFSLEWSADHALAIFVPHAR